MKKLFFIFFAGFLTLSLGISANPRNPNGKNVSQKTVTLEIESVEHLQALLPQIEQEILNCNFVELKIMHPLEVAANQLTILCDFGAILTEYETAILLLWQGNFVCPLQNGIALTHYEWWRWHKPHLDVNPENGAKWQIESVELYLFVNEEQPEAIFEVVESPYEDPAYIASISAQLECQGFPRPRDSYNYPLYPGMPEWGQLTMQERRDTCQIPENILQTMSTQAILQSLWEHPLLFYIFAHGYSYLMDFQTYILHTSSNQALIERTDAGVAFLYRLLMLDPLTQVVPEVLCTEPQAFEIVMCQMELLNQLPDGRKKQLIRITMINDSLRQENGSFYEFRSTSWLLIGRTLISANYAPFLDYLNGDKALERFLVFIFEEKHLTEQIRLTIKKYAEEYLKEEVECCENIDDLTSEKCDDNCVFLSWSEPESSFTVEGYNVYRNDTLLTEQPIIETSYLDENLPTGEYEYYVIAHYTDGCISNSSNHVKEIIGVGIETITNDELRITVYPNPTMGEFKVSGFGFNVTKIEIFDVFGRSVEIAHPSLREGLGGLLPSGVYFIRITTDKNIITKKVIKY